MQAQYTSTVKKVSKKWSYVWGRNPTYATFGPVQEFFQSVILFDPIFKIVALLEQGLVPIVHLKEDHFEDWVIEHDQTLTVDISGKTCISQADILKQPLAVTLKLVTAEALATIEQLTVEGSDFHSNSTGHVLGSTEVMLIVKVFLALYICSWGFLFFFLLFVGFTINSTEWWKEKVNSGKTRRIFYSTTVVLLILSICDLGASLALFGVEVSHISKNKRVWFLRDSTRKFAYQNKAYLYVILAVRTFTPIIFCLLSISVTFCHTICFNNITKQKFCSCKTFKSFAAYIILCYIFMGLFQIVPVMCHMVIYPVATFCIFVQCLCSLFIILLLAYQLTMLCCQLLHFPCKPFIGDIKVAFPKFYNACLAKCLPTGYLQDEQHVGGYGQLPDIGTNSLPTTPEEENPPTPPTEVTDSQTRTIATAQDVRTCCIYMIQAFMSLFGFCLILLIGFLYFAVIFMGVNPTTLTMFVIGIMTAIMSTTISGRLNKCFDKLWQNEGRTS